MYHTSASNAVVNQGDVDSEFAVSTDELFRAVERVDQPISLPAASLVVADRFTFFRQNWQSFGQTRKRISNQLMRPAVRFRER